MRTIWLWLFGLTCWVHAQDVPSIESFTAGMDRREGFLTLYRDERAGKVWLEIGQWQTDLLYVESLPAGLGSNDVGLDRGQLGRERIVHFERVGPKVLLVMPNLMYRARPDAPEAEKRAIRDSFAESVLWSFPIAATTGTRVLVDATPFVVRDAHGVVQTLQQTGQGRFSVQADRSALVMEMLKAFPRNTELEARVTFSSDDPGGYVRDTAADPNSVTLRQRHAFIALPDEAYQPREFDPRSGYFEMSYQDYSVPVGTDKTRRFITRHRLQKKNPELAVSEVMNPIVYYVDSGTPEPIRSALLEGASWWTEAFEKAGFKDAFRVEILPPDADPMDVRYNVIQWVHRATRGWSYGSSITDPRTGEILKGHVSLGSLRVRQDYLIAEGLLAPYSTPHQNGFSPENDPMLQMSLARLRQLSAHEVGHTLGLAHNFAASASNRASVMDYPPPVAQFKQDAAGKTELDLSQAYATGVGTWDVAAIQFGYTQFAAGTDEKTALNAILQAAQQSGLDYITDEDARPQGSAHPTAHLWDHGENPLVGLRREMDVRQFAMNRFGESVLKNGEPMARMEEALVPLYLRHRYQTEAVAKLLGGKNYAYTLRGDGQPGTTFVSAEVQREALRSLLRTLNPERLVLPDRLVALLPPRPPAYPQNRELFDGHTGLILDPVAPSGIASEMVLGLVAHPERAARLAYQQAFDPTLPDLNEVFTEVTRFVFRTTLVGNAYQRQIQYQTRTVWMDALMDLAVQSRVAPAVRAEAWVQLEQIANRVEGSNFHVWMSSEIRRFQARPYAVQEQVKDLIIPPGQPIGTTEPDWLQRKKARIELLRASEEAVCGTE